MKIKSHLVRPLAVVLWLGIFVSGALAVSVQNPLFTVRSVSGAVFAQFPGNTDFRPVTAGEKVPLGCTIRTEKSSDALISLLPGFCIKVDGNTVVTLSSVDYEETVPPRRSVLVDLHSGRLVAILERYFAGRTAFFVQTGEMNDGNPDAKDKSVALGGAWDAASCGAVAVTSDSGYSRISQVVGTGSWTRSNGDTSQIGTGSVVVDNNGAVSASQPITGDASAVGDQLYVTAAINDAIGNGLIDQGGCPGFSRLSRPIIQPLSDMVLGVPFNPLNAGIPTVTGVKAPAPPGRPNVTVTPTPVAQVTPTPPPVVSPSSLPEASF